MSVKTGEKYTVPTQVRIGHIHLKVSSTPEFVIHSTPFVAQAIGQERGTINLVPRSLNSGTAAYDVGIARVESFFSVIEPISVYV